ncbi:MAG: 4-alpha-glucanotransferase [SAR324 cluster bacterium]|nr:4-alpha-glucanotransferase [SAR324 cluster bacterium]
MKFSLLVSTASLKSEKNDFSSGSSSVLLELGELMNKAGLDGNIFELPIQAREITQLSPFSIQNGFALNPLDLDISLIPELQGAREKTTSIEKFNLIKELSSLHKGLFSGVKRINYELRSLFILSSLEVAFANFAPKGTRDKAFQDFKKASAYWLDDYAKFKVLAKAYPSFKLAELRKLNLKKSDEPAIALTQYVQFLCFEQRSAITAKLKAFNLGLVLNLPFGVETLSADIAYHPEVFDESKQVGCSPEPEHGYPEQAWGIAPYREQTAGLAKYLNERFSWLAQFGSGIFLDHLVGWCGQYVLPVKLPKSDGPHGEFLTESFEKREENILWLLDLLKDKNLSLMAEIAGDYNRLQATLDGLAKARKKGLAMSVMEIPRWIRGASGTIKPLAQYEPSSLMMLETHDTSTLLQYLTNQKGDQADFESPEVLLDFCRNFLSWPLFYHEVPLKLIDLNPEVAWELFERIYHGSQAGELVFTYGGLVSLLHPKYFSTDLEMNINIAPGTSGEIGNLRGNWSYFAPPLEAFADLVPKLKALGPRACKDIEPVRGFYPDQDGPELLVSNLKNKKAIYQSFGGYKVYQGPLKPTFELLMFNPQDHEVSGMLDFYGLGLDLDEMELSESLEIQDLKGEGKSYSHKLEDLKAKGLFYKMAPKQTHHLIIAASN